MWCLSRCTPISRTVSGPTTSQCYGPVTDVCIMDEMMRPLCLASASYVPINLVCYVTSASRAQKKDRSFADQPYDRSRLSTESARCHPSSVLVRDYLRSELDFFFSSTVYPSLASESTTANSSTCMTGVGWNLAEQGHSQPTQVNNMTLGRDPVISNLLCLFVLFRVGLRCSILLLQMPNRCGAVRNGCMRSLGFHCGCREHGESRRISRLT